MLNERKILMGDDGVFTASVDALNYSLMFDTQRGYGRWLLSLHEDDSSGMNFLSSHPNLDAGLHEIAIHAGWGRKRFSVILQDGERFSRPGKVPAEEIMAAHDYVLAGSITAFGILNGYQDVSPDRARTEVMGRLGDLVVELGSVEAIPDDECGWVFDVSVLFEGYIHQEEMLPLMTRYLDGLGFEVSDAIEGALSEARPNAAAIINAFDEAA